MTWYHVIRELCEKVRYEATVKDILTTALNEKLITTGEAEQIAFMFQRDFRW